VFNENGLVQDGRRMAVHIFSSVTRMHVNLSSILCPCYSNVHDMSFCVLCVVIYGYPADILELSFCERC